jgi:peptidoglycan/xylan/chitin deacetylase (PgdA/CDA1 family)
MRIAGKRELLGRGLSWSGASFLLSNLPPRDMLLVLAYHRIGNPAEDQFDPAVFSATADEFDRHVGTLKRRASLVTLEEAVSFIDGSAREKTRRCRVLMTFDDGYLDNYQTVYPILSSHGAQGVFFLVTGMVGSCEVPWWDRTAYLVKTARRRKFVLRYPAELAVDIDRDGVAASTQAILWSYKNPANSDPDRFLRELAEAADSEALPQPARRFLNWDEAREMSRGGMAIGSHTHSHHVLSQLELDRQRDELSKSRAILKEQLGLEPAALAYPVGHTSSFSRQTQEIAAELGYRAAFSHYGGTNLPGKTTPFDVRRSKVGTQSESLFRVQTAVCRATGKFWP